MTLPFPSQYLSSRIVVLAIVFTVYARLKMSVMMMETMIMMKAKQPASVKRK